jgi:hypothetical protein
MDQGLSELLGVGIAARVAQRDHVGRAIVLDHARVVDRNIGCALLEVADRIAACRHDLANKLIGLVGGAGRIVHELGLNGLPAVA